MPGIESLRRAEDFGRIFRAGVSARASGVVICAAPGETEKTRLGLAVRASGAVERNRVKRRLRAACRTVLAEAQRSPVDLAVRADGRAASVSFQELVNLFRTAVSR